MTPAGTLSIKGGRNLDHLPVQRFGESERTLTMEVTNLQAPRFLVDRRLSRLSGTKGQATHILRRLKNRLLTRN